MSPWLQAEHVLECGREYRFRIRAPGATSLMLREHRGVDLLTESRDLHEMEDFLQGRASDVMRSVGEGKGMPLFRGEDFIFETNAVMLAWRCVRALL